MVPLSFGCGSAVFAAMATLAPSRAARNAIASPMPRLPPDTNSVLPLSSVIAVSFSWCHAVKSHSPQGRRERTFARERPSGIRLQDPAARFRQREGSDEEQSVGHHGKDSDGVAERCLL